MNAHADRLDLSPPPAPGRLRAMALALLAHLLLAAALTWGVGWQRHSTPVAVEAELWAAVPQAAAAREEAPPPPPPAQEPPQAQPAPPPPTPPDIATEREKQRQAREQKEAEQRREAEKQAQKQDAERRARDKERERAEAQARALREDNMRRIMGMAGATGAPGATGSAATAAGPSASYAGRIMARIKPNIVFADRDRIPGNPEALVVVRLAPDGTIVSRRLARSSGHADWDEAVLRALDRTEVLPRDTDGRVVPEFQISFRPRD